MTQLIIHSSLIFRSFISRTPFVASTYTAPYKLRIVMFTEVSDSAVYYVRRRTICLERFKKTQKTLVKLAARSVGRLDTYVHFNVHCNSR